MTIHSFFKFPIDKIMLGVDDVPADAHLTELLRYTDCIVIDEISMVREEMRKLTTPGIVSTGQLTGIFPMHELPVPISRTLRIGSRVMVVCNGKRQKMPGWLTYEYVNGEIGTIYGFDEKQEIVCLKMETGRYIKVKRSRWSNIRYALGKDENGDIIISSEEIGLYRQFPLLPAWAMSIHKAQGQTLDCRTHLFLGPGGCFASGQLYTALSRVRNFGDLSIDRPIKYADIIVDSMVIDFLIRTFQDKFNFSDEGLDYRPCR